MDFIGARTAQLLKSLPHDRGCTVITNTGRRREWLRRAIADRRGHEIASHVTILIVASRAQAEQQLMGRRGPIFPEPEWSVSVAPDVAAFAGILIERANEQAAAADRRVT